MYTVAVSPIQLLQSWYENGFTIQGSRTGTNSGEDKFDHDLHLVKRTRPSLSTPLRYGTATTLNTHDINDITVKGHGTDAKSGAAEPVARGGELDDQVQAHEVKHSASIYAYNDYKIKTDRDDMGMEPLVELPPAPCL